MVLESIFSLESLLVTLVAYATYNFVTNNILTPLKCIPGPWYTSLTSMWYHTHLAKGDQLTSVRKLHQTYGPLVRIAPNVVSVGDVDAARVIYSSHRFTKGPIYEGFHFANSENTFSTSNPEFYKTRKRLVAPAFTSSAVNDMESIILDAGVYSLTRRLERHADGSQVVDMLKLFSFMTFDAMGEIALGKSFNLLEEEDHPVIGWMHSTLMLGIYKTVFGSLTLPALFPSHFTAERNLINFALEAVRRRQKDAARPDSLQKLIDVRDEDSGAQLVNSEIATETIVQLVAGTDTTSTTLTWALYQLLNHPECMKKLQAELDTAFPDIGTLMTHEMVKDLPYLHAIINETLRINPVAAGDAQRFVPEEGVELCGQFIPGGTIVVPQMYVLHHLESHWPDSDAFKPERWLASPERVQEMKRAFIPFSVGVRACLGRSLAWMELRVALAAIIRKFDFSFVPGADMTPQHRFIVRPKGGVLQVTLRKRSE